MLLCMIVLTEKNVKISTTYNFLDFSFFMSQDDAHYQNHLNAPLFKPINYNWFSRISWQGKGDATKTDEFLEKFQRRGGGGGGSFQSNTLYCSADFGPLNRAFSRMTMRLIKDQFDQNIMRRRMRKACGS